MTIPTERVNIKPREMTLEETTQALSITVERAKSRTRSAASKLTVQKIPRATKGQGKFVKAPIVANFETRGSYEDVSVEKCRVDLIYQRRYSRSRVTKMAHEWNQEQFGVPVLSLRRDGFYYEVDGQQRIDALKMISNHPDTIFAQVFRGLTREEEAALYAKLDTERYGLSSGARFKALLAAKDPSALEIKEVAESCGLSVDYDKGPVVNNIRAYKTLMDIHRRMGREGLRRILHVSSSAWARTTYAGNADIFSGMEVFFSRYPNAKDERLIEVLTHATPTLIYSESKLYTGIAFKKRNVWTSIAKVLHAHYNNRLRASRLPDWD